MSKKPKSAMAGVDGNKLRRRGSAEAAAPQSRSPLSRWSIRGVIGVLIVAPVLFFVWSAITAPGKSAGLQETQAPWPAEHANLAARFKASGFPAVGNESYHIHVFVNVYVDGEHIPVPEDIGMSPSDRLMTPVHTHDGSGLIHLEAAQRFPFKLTDVFTIWGVRFSENQIGGYKNDQNQSVLIYVNGDRVIDYMNYVLNPHDNVVVAYGVPPPPNADGLFPTKPPVIFPPGL